MSESRSLRNLRRTLYVIAFVPILTGLSTVILGSESVAGGGDPNANIESELRFYSTWWLAAGCFLLWLAPRVGERTRELRVFCALLFLSGLSRVFAALETDWPSGGQIALMVAEWVLAIGFVAWQAHATRDSRGRAGFEKK